jgi:hypothetical protein
VTEQDFKKDLINALQYIDWVVQAHEDRISNYISDLSFSGQGVDGWIEVKYLNESVKTLNDIPHWTKGQESFLTSRGHAGSGHCYLIIGTSIGIGVWKWDTLSRVRHLPWSEAVRHCFTWSMGLKQLAEQLEFRVRARRSAGVGAS